LQPPPARTRSFGSDGARPQVYVALSRLRGLEGLRLRGFRRRTVHANKLALEFYRELGGVRPGRITRRWVGRRAAALSDGLG
jgi:hypothetical protein